MYALLSECWHQVPASRPLFDDIVERVQSSYAFELAHTEKAKLQQDDHQLFGAQQSGVLREDQRPEIAPFDSEETQGPAAVPSAHSSSSGARSDIETAAADFDQKVDSTFEANSNPSGGADRDQDHGNRGGESVSSSDLNAIRPNEPVKRISNGRRWSYFFNGNGDDENGGSADASSRPVPADGGGVGGVATTNDLITADSHDEMYCREFLPPTDTDDVSHDTNSVPQTPNYVPPPPNRMSQHSRAAHAGVEQSRSHHHEGQNRLLHSERAQNDRGYGRPQHVAHSGRGSDGNVASGGSRPFTDGDRLEMAGNGPVAHRQEQTVFRRPRPGSANYIPQKPAGNSGYGKNVGINLPPSRGNSGSRGGGGGSPGHCPSGFERGMPSGGGSMYAAGAGAVATNHNSNSAHTVNNHSRYGHSVHVGLTTRAEGAHGSGQLLDRRARVQVGHGSGAGTQVSAMAEDIIASRSEPDDPLAQSCGTGGFEKHDRLKGGRTAQVHHEETHEVGGGSMYAVAVAGQRAGERTRHGHQKHKPRRRGSTIALLDEDGDPDHFEI